MAIIEGFTRTPLQRAQRRVQYWDEQLKSAQDAEAAARQRHEAQMDAVADGGDAKELTKTRDALRVAGQKVAEAKDGLRKAQAEVAQGTAALAAAEVTRNRNKGLALLHENETTLAAGLQSHAKALAQTYAKIEANRQQAIGLLPDCRERMKMMTERWHTDGALLVAIQQQLLLYSDGLVGDPRACGFYSLGELRAIALDIPATMAATHRQFTGISQDKEAA
jgi:hypothetical protein